MTAKRWPPNPPLGEAPFRAHIELLHSFLSRRAEIVGRIEGLLNAQHKPAHYLRDVPLLARDFEDCLFGLAGVSDDQARLRRELDEAHWASGFKPRRTPGQHNDLIDPAELMSRGFRLWQHTRWPGRHARVGYAHTLFNVYLLRRLMLLAMRLWDAETPSAGERLAHIQAVLDELWRTTPADQPVLVRDARWLLPLAQSPTTDELAGYFEVAERIASTFSHEDRIAIQKASVRMAGGHLRSQLRHVSTQQGVSLDEQSVVRSTRKSNALDVATLVQGLVPLLEAYGRALQRDDGDTRLELAAAVCEGISPDPDLFVNRLDLLGPYSMIEHVFVTPDRSGQVVYTHAGERHLRLLEEYKASIDRLAKPLYEDCRRFRPVAGAYSPYGALYGFSSQLLEHMALKTLAPDATTRFSLEDVFADGGADKLAWVSGWRKLPHVPREVAKLFEYPQRFAEEVFARVERALRQRAAVDPPTAPRRNGRLLVVPDDALSVDPHATLIPDLTAAYVLSSDRHLVAAGKAEFCDQPKLLHGRLEGELLVSYETPGGWVGISKDILTDVLGAGRDAKIAGLPREAARVLQAMYPELIALSEPQPAGTTSNLKSATTPSDTFTTSE